jgi:phosphoglycerate-specific signal transduction histidine kinase
MASQTLDANQTLITKLQSLPAEQQQQVLDFLEFLAQKYVSSVTSQSQCKKRFAGLHEGMGWMSEDFNEPLPDEFWVW